MSNQESSLVWEYEEEYVKIKCLSYYYAGGSFRASWSLNDSVIENYEAYSSRSLERFWKDFAHFNILIDN